MQQVHSSRILIVDDEPSVRMTLEMALSETPHHVESVESAELALVAIRERTFDLLIVDKNLPGINGAELIRTVRQTHEDIWSAMITGYPSAESAMEMLHLGVRGYLEKPFEDVFEVVRRVEHLLELKQAQRRMQGGANRMRNAAQYLPAARPLSIVVLAPDEVDRRWLLQRTGNPTDTVLGAASAQEALSLIATRAPDLVVCDSTLRQPDLFTFIQSARVAAPEVSFAVLCDTPSLRMLTGLIEARASAVIPRPLSESTYKNRVEGLLMRLRMAPAPTAPAVPPH
jgi:DNA-binding NtrC family response regulator